MFHNRLRNFAGQLFMLALSHREVFRRLAIAPTKILPFTILGLSSVNCDSPTIRSKLEDSELSHEFLIRQSCTINVNAATQFLTVILVAIQDTNQRLREFLTKEICLVRQAMEWGEEATPSEHWDQLIAVRGTLVDLRHNIQTLLSYMEYAEKLATTAAEVSYLSGNTAASDAICERISQADRACNNEKKATHQLQQESLQIQKDAILSSAKIEELLKSSEPTDGILPKAKIKSIQPKLNI